MCQGLSRAKPEGKAWSLCLPIRSKHATALVWWGARRKGRPPPPWGANEMLGRLCQPSRTRRGKVELESSCVTAPSLIGESHPVRGRIRYHHQILNEIVPRMDAAPFFCLLLFFSFPCCYFLLRTSWSALTRPWGDGRDPADTPAGRIPVVSLLGNEKQEWML